MTLLLLFFNFVFLSIITFVFIIYYFFRFFSICQFVSPFSNSSFSNSSHMSFIHLIFYLLLTNKYIAFIKWLVLGALLL